MGAKSVGLVVVSLAVGIGLGVAFAAARQRSLDEENAAHDAMLREKQAGIDAALEREIQSAKSAATVARGETAVLEKQLKDLRAELAAEKTRADAAVAAQTGAEAELRRAGGSAPVAAQRLRPTFAFEQFGDALDKVDWASVAEHTTAIVGPIREIADALLAGQPVPLKAAGETQKHNGPLIQAVGVIADKLSGTGPNGAYTHPAFQVNALAAALDKIGKPLSASQRTALADIGVRFTEEERKRIGSYDDSTFQMRKLVEEGDLKDRFYNAVRAMLTADQLDAISPPATRDRVAADLWSEGLLWATVTRPVKFERKEQVTEVVSRTLGAVWKLDDAQKAKLAEIAADWTSHLPQTLLERKPDALEAVGMSPADVVAIGAAETRKLVERAATDLTLSGDQLASARKWGVVFFPVPGDRDE